MATSDAALEKESQEALITSLAIIFVTLSTVAVVLRMYTRRHLLHNVGPDDTMIGVAQVLAIAVSITTILEAVWGLGRHTRFVSPTDAIKQLRCLYANTIIYNAAQTLTKVSFLVLYRRLFPSHRIQNVTLWFLGFIVVWGVIQEFIVALSCMPLETVVPSMAGKCIWTLPVWYLTSCMNIATDFGIFVIPIFPVFKLQMRTRQKVLLLGLFCLGFFACVISLIRLSTLHQGINTTDPFWDNAPAAYWSVVELNCGILCACLPTLRPLVSKVMPKLLSTYGGSVRRTVDTSDRYSETHAKSRDDGANAIYVQKEIELHSTTELRTAVHSSSFGDETQSGVGAHGSGKPKLDQHEDAASLPSCT